jgi:hypothetical protein
MHIKKKVLNDGQLLFRANKSNARNGTVGSTNYRGATFKYFTLTKNEVSAYTKYGTTYTKTWKITDNLNLIDILDYKTRQELESEFITNNEKKALNTAFPIENNTVSRNSINVNTDNIVLKRLCELGYDGYYMKTINAFHSEVGLCSSALSKIKLVKSEKVVMPNRVNKTKKKSRYTNNNNNGAPKVLSFF